MVLPPDFDLNCEFSSISIPQTGSMGIDWARVNMHLRLLVYICKVLIINI